MPVFAYTGVSKKRFALLAVITALLNMLLSMSVVRFIVAPPPSSPCDPRGGSIWYAFGGINAGALSQMGFYPGEHAVGAFYGLFCMTFVFLGSAVILMAWDRRINYRFLVNPEMLARFGRRRAVKIELTAVREVRATLMRGVAFRTAKECLRVPYWIFPLEKLLRYARIGVVAGGGRFTKGELDLALARARIATFVYDNIWRMILLAVSIPVSFATVAICALIALAPGQPSGPGAAYAVMLIITYLAALMIFAWEGLLAARRFAQYKSSYEGLRRFAALAACMALAMSATVVISLAVL